MRLPNMLLLLLLILLLFEWCCCYREHESWGLFYFKSHCRFSSCPSRPTLPMRSYYVSDVDSILLARRGLQRRFLGCYCRQGRGYKGVLEMHNTTTKHAWHDYICTIDCLSENWSWDIISLPFVSYKLVTSFRSRVIFFSRHMKTWHIKSKMIKTFSATACIN